MSSSGVVLPEAVELELESADLASRGVAMLVDLLIIAVLLIVSLFASVAAAATLGQTAAVVVMSVLSFLVIIGYFAIFETLLRGRTPGKAALGLRVVTVEGAPIGFRHAAIRGALQLVELVATVGGAAVVSILLTARAQRLGDLAAGTVVLRERGGTATPTLFTLPREAEPYAATLDVTPLTPQAYAAIRSLLVRGHAMTAGRRIRVAESLATPVARAMGHTPPSGVSAEQFLRCVVWRVQQGMSGHQAAPGAARQGAANEAAPPATSTDAPSVRDPFA